MNIAIIFFVFLERARDEKFNKIKDLYVKLREEHIQLLRQVNEYRPKLIKCKLTLKIFRKRKSKRKSVQVHEGYKNWKLLTSS